MLIKFNRDRVFRAWIARELPGSSQISFGSIRSDTMGIIYSAHICGFNVALTAPPRN